MQGNVVCGQHADAQTRRQRRVQEIANQSLVLNKQQQQQQQVRFTDYYQNEGIIWTMQGEQNTRVFEILPKCVYDIP